MTKTQMDLMPDNSEIIHYDNPGIPLFIQKGLLSNYPAMRALCHWHDDIELIYVIEGEMNYYINGKTVLIKEHDGIMVNTREMHYGYSEEKKECRFLCVLFHPSLLMSCKRLAEQYVTPFLYRCNFTFLYLSHTETPDILNSIYSFWISKNSQDGNYELEVIGKLYSLWNSFIQIRQNMTPEALSEPSINTISLRKMVSYIHTHYKEEISLEQIAKAGSVCKSKCCGIFKSQGCQSPFVFLNTYRIRLSADLLIRTSHSVTDISFDCGFNHLSYYSKLFFKYFGCTPTEYRRMYQCSN